MVNTGNDLYRGGRAGVSTSMWQKNALFVGLCLVGLVWLGKSVLRRERVEPPRAATTSISDDLVSTRDAIDAEFRQVWSEQNLQPAPKSDSLTIVRRLSLALTGTAPSLEEIRALEKVPDDRRVQWWVSYLLEDRRFADYVAERLARPMIGTEDGPFIIFRGSRDVGWVCRQLEK